MKYKRDFVHIVVYLKFMYLARTLQKRSLLKKNKVILFFNMCVCAYVRKNLFQFLNLKISVKVICLLDFERLIIYFN